MRVQGSYHRVSIVHRPAAGPDRGRWQVRRVLKRIAAERHLIQVLDAAALDAAALLPRLRASDAVIVVGDERLVHQVLPALVDLGIPLAILPATAGRDALERVGSFLAGQGTIRWCDVLELEYEREPEHTRYVLGTLNFGFSAEAGARAAQLPRWLGASRRVIAPLLCVRRVRGRQLEVQSVDFSFAGKVLAGSIVNLPPGAGQPSRAGQTRAQAGRARLTLLPDAPRFRALPALLRHLVRDRHVPPAARISSAAVRYAGISYGDGQVLGRGNYTVTVRPGSLALVGPGRDGTR